MAAMSAAPLSSRRPTSGEASRVLGSGIFQAKRLLRGAQGLFNTRPLFNIRDCEVDVA